MRVCWAPETKLSPPSRSKFSKPTSVYGLAQDYRHSPHREVQLATPYCHVAVQGFHSQFMACYVLAVSSITYNKTRRENKMVIQVLKLTKAGTPLLRLHI